MASISMAFALEDKMSRTLYSITNALGSTLSAMRSVQSNPLGPEFAQAAADIKLAENTINEFNDELKKVPENTQKAGDGFTAMKGVATHAIMGIANMVRDQLGGAFDRIDTMERFNRTMTALTGDAALAKGALDDLRETVTDTAYGLDVASKATQMFVTSGMDIDKATGVVKDMANAVSFYGEGTNAALQQTTNALSDIYTEGTVTAAKIRSLTLAGIPVYKMYSEAVGRSVADIKSDFKYGEIGAEEFVFTLTNAMQNGTESFASLENAAKEAGASWAGTFDNMNTAITRGLVNMLEIFDDTLEKMGLPTLREFITQFGKDIEATLIFIGENFEMLAFTVGTVVAIKLHSQIVSLIIQLGSLEAAMTKVMSSAGIMFAAFGLGYILMKNNDPIIKAVGASLTVLAGALAIAKAMMWLFNVSVYANPIFIGATVTAMALASIAVVQFADHIDGATNSVEDLTTSIGDMQSTMDKINIKSVDEIKKGAESAGGEWVQQDLQVQGYIKTLQDLENQNIYTEGEQQQLNAAVNGLNQLLPGITQYLINENGQLAIQWGVVNDLTTAYHNLAQAKAQAAVKEKIMSDIYEQQYDFIKKYDPISYNLQTAKANAQLQAEEDIKKAKESFISTDERKWGLEAAKVFWGTAAYMLPDDFWEWIYPEPEKWNTIADSSILQAGKQQQEDIKNINAGINELDNISKLWGENKAMQDNMLNEIERYLPDINKYLNNMATEDKIRPVRVTNKLDIKEESIKLLHDVSTRGYRLNFQRLEPTLNLTATIHETADSDDVINRMADGLTEFSNTALARG